MEKVKFCVTFCCRLASHNGAISCIRSTALVLDFRGPNFGETFALEQNKIITKATWAYLVWMAREVFQVQSRVIVYEPNWLENAKVQRAPNCKVRLDFFLNPCSMFTTMAKIPFVIAQFRDEASWKEPRILCLITHRI